MDKCVYPFSMKNLNNKGSTGASGDIMKLIMHSRSLNGKSKEQTHCDRQTSQVVGCALLV